MSFDVDTLQNHLPSYLSAEDQRALVDGLKDISQSGGGEYVLPRSRDSFAQTMLQGDGWHGFVVYSFANSKVQEVPGIVLSNSCDVAPENERDFATRVTFAPLAKLAVFENLLHESGIDASRVEDKLKSIRAQKITNLFYLPAGGQLEHDYVVRLDEAQSMPISVHTKNPTRSKLFTLSPTGFYMLVFKLSIHFCRLQERVQRKAH